MAPINLAIQFEICSFRLLGLQASSSWTQKMIRGEGARTVTAEQTSAEMKHLMALVETRTGLHTDGY